MERLARSEFTLDYTVSVGTLELGRLSYIVRIEHIPLCCRICYRLVQFVPRRAAFHRAYLETALPRSGNWKSDELSA